MVRKIAVALCYALVVPSANFAQDVNLTVTGDGDALSGALDDALLIRSVINDGDANPQDLVAAARADYRRLLTALYADGYYSGTVSIRVDGREAAAIAPLDAPNNISTIDVTVDTGPAFQFGRAEITPTAPETALPDGFATGETARSAVIRQSVSASVTAWRDLGYAKAAPSGQKVTANHSDRVLDVDITIAPGPKLSFGNLTITGNQAVRTQRIAEIAGLPVGETYSPEQISKSESRLRRTGAFDSVAIIESDDFAADNSLPMALTVVETKPRRLGFGVEFSSVEGLTVSSFWLHRNLLGGAERLRVDGAVSGIGGGTGGIDYSLGANFKRPATFGADTDFFATAEISREDEPDYLVDKIEVTAGLNRIVRDDLTAEAGVGVVTAREETDAGVREYTLLTLPLKATLDRRDDPNNASNGYYLDIEATPFVSLQGAANGARLYADARVFRSFGADDAVTIAARGQIGSVIGPDIADAPADFLFYSGGGGTVRGQPYKSLGIDTTIGAETNTTGGLSFAGAQLEARYLVRPKIGIVGFYDVGYIGASTTPFEDGDWQAGAGIGVRYDTAIGPIRLDIGTPATGDNAGRDVQVYIGIGQSF